MANVDRLGGRTTREEVLRQLQTRHRATASELADVCGVSDAAMRLHLDHLESERFIERVVERVVPDEGSSTGRGRPPSVWRLRSRNERTGDAHYPDTFPDRHDELAADLLAIMNDRLGAATVARVIELRSERQVAEYSATIGRRASVLERAKALAAQRDREGYRAEVVRRADGVVELIENHCAIDRAARTCGSLCEAELDVFRRTLGDEVAVVRKAHLRSGDDCCRYEISPR